jgi:excisionase family DNA binding protein
LNLRPLGPERPGDPLHGVAPGFTASHTVEITGPARDGKSHTVAGSPPDMTPGPAPVLRPGERFLTPAQVAAALQVSRATVYRLIDRGELRARRVGLQLRVLAADLNAFLRST